MRTTSPTTTLLALTPARLVAAIAVFTAADWAYMGAGDSLFPGGPLDETAHFLTMLLVLWALGDRFRAPRILVPALVATVLIDADHIPGYLGHDWLTAGTPRPYTHSLLTLAVVLAVALVWRRHRVSVLAVALGIAVHLWRDMSESSGGVSIFATPRPSVSLLWPWTKHAYSLPHASYLAVLAVVVGVCAARCRRTPRLSAPRAASAAGIPARGSAAPAARDAGRSASPPAGG